MAEADKIGAEAGRWGGLDVGCGCLGTLWRDADAAPAQRHCHPERRGLAVRDDVADHCPQGQFVANLDGCDGEVLLLCVTCICTVDPSAASFDYQ